MKKLILLELAFLFLATTFQSDNPSGWYQQTLPVNDFINDIFFLDSLNGWVITNSNMTSSDTAYILNTTNGGGTWTIQFQQTFWFTELQFVDKNIGYVVGAQPPGIILKTTNSGDNWFVVSTISAAPIRDLFFVNKDIGWICSDDLFDGGVFKTIDGGSNWMRLTDPGEFTKLFFLNADTGWVNANGTQKRLYRTTNGGTNWELQFAFPQQINDIFFVNGSTGYVSSGRMFKTTNGGINWTQCPSDVGGIQLTFVSDSIGWGGVNFNLISKTINGGNSWFYQPSPIFNNSSVNGIDSLNAWAGGSGLVRTTDGGGLSGIENTNLISEKFILKQNFPNPFNPSTEISYELWIASYVRLIVFNIKGEEIKELVNGKQNAGEYKLTFDGSKLSSGTYFYRLEIRSDKKGVFSDTKKMILIR